jgi:hypothetical protein
MTEENKDQQNAEEKKDFAWIDENKVIMNISTVMGITRFDNLILNGYEECHISDFVIYEGKYKHVKHMESYGYASDLIEIGLCSMLSFIHAKRITKANAYFQNARIMFKPNMPIILMCDENIALMVAPRAESE